MILRLSGDGFGLDGARGGVGSSGAFGHIHGDAAIELRTLHDADARSMHVALEPGGVLDLYRLLGLEIALDGAFDHDGLGADVRLHDPFAADSDTLGVGRV